MYVLCSPCILNPSLRADGITRPSDIELFERVRKRCHEFGIEMVPLPCPETIYLGAGRKPGTFLERLNTPEFAKIMEDITRNVNSIISKRGPPLAIIGVNSSPTCGVTSTYYGEEKGKPPKREGRGVFLAKFPGIPAMDVGEFSKYRVYLAAPLFSEAERRFNATIAGLLRTLFFRVYLPQETGDCSSSRDDENHAMIFQKNLQELNASDIVVAVIDGADADSGTAWEMGYAYASGKRIIALRTDFRKVGDHESVNLMLELSSSIVRSEKDLIQELAPFH